MALIEVNNLQVSFAQKNQIKTAVESVSFAVEANETFSLIGASGCGKSTVLRTLAGLQREWQGEITLLGQRLQPANVSPANYVKMCRWCFKIRMPRCTLNIIFNAP